MDLAKIKCPGYGHVMQWATLLLYTGLNVGQILCMGENQSFRGTFLTKGKSVMSTSASSFLTMTWSATIQTYSTSLNEWQL